MKEMSLRQGLIQLKELISSGAETMITLQTLDRLILRFGGHTYSETRTASSHKLLDEVKRHKKRARELEQENCCLKESTVNLKVDMEMVDIRMKKLERENTQLRHQELKEEGRENKKNSKKTKETEVQCDSLSAELFEELILIVQNYKRKNEELYETHIQLSRNRQESQSAASTAEGEDWTGDEEEYQTGETENPEELLGQLSLAVQTEPKGTPLGDQSSSENIFDWLKVKACQLVSSLKSQ